jgi:hypothetical protein
MYPATKSSPVRISISRHPQLAHNLLEHGLSACIVPIIENVSGKRDERGIMNLEEVKAFLGLNYILTGIL